MKSLPPVLTDVVSDGDVGMVEQRGRTSFIEQARPAFRIGLEALGQEFQRHGSSQPDILGQIDLSHPTPAKTLDDPVMLNGCTDHSHFF